MKINNLNNNDLIVFDLDNTIIQAKQTLASDQWFRAYAKRLKDNGMSDAQAMDELIPLYNAAQHITEVEIVEASVVSLINEFKSSGAHVIGLTARNHELVTPTLRHLQSVNVSFTDTKPFAKVINNNYVLSQDGVVFANGQDKGRCLGEYLKEHNVSPQRIVFIDDSLKNVKKVKTYADNNSINFLGYRYGYLDEKVAAIDIELADQQLKNLKILSDEEAKNLIA